MRLTSGWSFLALALVVGVNLSVRLSAQPGVEVKAPASWVDEFALGPAGPAKPHASGLDYLLLDEQIRISSQETYRRRAYQIVSDSGRQNGSQVSITFDPSYQTLTLHHLRLVRGETSVDKLDLSRVQVLQQERDLDRQLYNGDRSALIILEDVRIGDVIDLAYTLRGRNPVFDGHFIDGTGLGWTLPVREFRYRIVAPRGNRLQSRIHGESDPDIQRRDLNATEEEFMWRATDLPLVQPEDQVPAEHVVFPFLDVSDFATWSEVVAWARPLYADDAASTPLVDAVVTDLRRAGASDETLAVAALDFVQQEIRYLGIEMGAGSHRPSAPEEVLRRRFGDCKDKARLLVALLRGLGITAVPALVNSNSGELLTRRLPSPYAFDHVVVAVELGGHHHLFDPTLTYQRGSAAAERHVGSYRACLRIAAGTTQLEPVRLGPGDTSRTIVQEAFSVESIDGPVKLTVLTRYEGRAAQSIRAYFAENNPEQIGRGSQDFYNRYYPGIASAAPVTFKDDAARNRFTVTEVYTIKSLFSPAGTGPTLQAEFQPGSIWDHCRIPSLGQRKYPYYVAHPLYLEQHISIHLPRDWPVEASNRTVKDPAFDLTVKVENPTPRVIQLSHTWRSQQNQVPVNQLEAFAANIQLAQAELGYRLSYNPALQAGAAYPLNWPMVGLAIAVLSAGIVLIWRIARRRNPTPPAEPPPFPTPSATAYGRPGIDNLEGLGGWLILVGFGLLISPLIIGSTFVTGHSAYFNHAVWQALTTPDSSSHVANFAFVAPFEMVLNLVLLLFNALQITLFFRRSHLFPRCMQVYLAFQVVATFLILWSNSLIKSAPDPTSTQEAYTQLMRSLFAAAIWIPYFQTSRRVKRTFVR
ncbi:MAG: DUF3857 domain-containing protein [Opitutaceae bacterium]